LKEIAIHPENFKTPYQLALHLGQKIFISFEQENEVLLDQLDKMENEVFLKNVSNSAQIKRFIVSKEK
jgi:magnesium transporter